MKNPSVISFLTTLLLAAALYTEGQELVKDSDGNPLDANQQYFIKPVRTINFNGGGLIPAPILPSFCPLVVFQAAFSYLQGQPSKFLVPAGTTNIEISSTVEIQFQSDAWTCPNVDPGLLVVADSPATEPPILIGGESSPKSEFKIEKAGEGNIYKLTTTKGTVGTIPGPALYFGARQLVVTDDEDKIISVQFKKFDDLTTATTSMIKMFPSY